METKKTYDLPFATWIPRIASGRELVQPKDLITRGAQLVVQVQFTSESLRTRNADSPEDKTDDKLERENSSTSLCLFVLLRPQ
jgi:hypothetical protein